MKNLLLLLALISVTACSTGDKARQQSAINKKNVETVLIKGTSQTKVIETFGSPNTVTSEGSREVWGYLRRARDSKGSGIGATVFHSTTSYITNGWYSGRMDQDSSTSHDTTLLVYFDKNKKVIHHSFRSEIF